VCTVEEFKYKEIAYFTSIYFLEEHNVSHLVLRPNPMLIMCAQESSLHTYHTENGYRITNVTI
jgi:hypothetical protein